MSSLDELHQQRLCKLTNDALKVKWKVFRRLRFCDQGSAEFVVLASAFVALTEACECLVSGLGEPHT